MKNIYVQKGLTNEETQSQNVSPLLHFAIKST